MSEITNDKDSEYAKDALTFVSGVVKAPPGVHTIQNQLAASKMLLDFTKEKPTQRKDVTVKRAEDYLDEIEEDDDDGTDGEAEEDTEASS